MSEEEMATIANMMRAMFAEQERKLDARFEAFRGEVGGMFAEQERKLDARFEAQERKLDARFEAFRVEVGVDIARHFKPSKNRCERRSARSTTSTATCPRASRD